MTSANEDRHPENQPLLPGAESAWEYLHRLVLWDECNQPVTPVLVFDQFEEVFTLCPDMKKRQAFFETVLGALPLLDRLLD